MCIKSKCFAKIEGNSTEKRNKDLKIRKNTHEKTNIKVRAKMQRSLDNATKIKKAQSVGLGDPDTIQKEL